MRVLQRLLLLLVLLSAASCGGRTVLQHGQGRARTIGDEVATKAQEINFFLTNVVVLDDGVECSFVLTSHYAETIRVSPMSLKPTMFGVMLIDADGSVWKITCDESTDDVLPEAPESAYYALVLEPGEPVASRAKLFRDMYPAVRLVKTTKRINRGRHARGWEFRMTADFLDASDGQLSTFFDARLSGAGVLKTPPTLE